MISQKLDLHFAQVARAFSNSSANKYSDSKIKNFHDLLELAFETIKKTNFKSISDPVDLISYRTVLNFILQHFEYLDTSIIGKYPSELIFCLDVVLEEWIDDYEKYFILTSLSHNNNEYKIDNKDIKNYEFLGNEISRISGNPILFEHTPVRLIIPRFQSHCFLANAVLYHEIGHFIDFKFSLIKKLFDQDDFLSSIKPENKEKIKSHYTEYFCDVFAAQYVGCASNNYLNYISYKSDENDIHPSTDLRIEMVNDFISGRSNEVLDKIIPGVKAITKREISLRFENLTVDNFDKGNPIIIDNKAKLSSLFPYAWNVWLDRDGEFRKRHGDELLSAHNEMNQLMISSVNSIAD